jgi:hypothetical protein
MFSVFSHGSTRKSSGSMSPTLTTPEPSPTHHQFLPSLKNDNRNSSGSQISASQLAIPGVDGHRSAGNSPVPTLQASPAHPCRSGEVDRRPTPLSPTSILFPSLDTQARISPTTIPSQKFLSQIPHSLALRTATISTPLPIVKPARPSQTKQKSKMRNRFFGARNKQVASPTAYELAGRSTFALVHGAILRYHSAFGFNQNDNTPPDSTHFLNGESIVCVTDAIQGFKWVLEIKTWSKGSGIRSPIKKTKSARKLAEKKVDLNQLPWEVVDNLQAWYLVFENPSLMTEWMTQLRAAVHSINERELRGERSTPKATKASRTLSKENRIKSNKVKSPLNSSPTSTITESLPSSPASSRKSFPRESIDGITSKRNSIVDVVNARRPSTATQEPSASSLEDIGQAQLRRRQPSQQDITLTAPRISAFEEDLASFVPPSVTEQWTPELKITSPPLKSDTEPAHSAAPLTPNLSHYANKRASIISLQSRLSSLSSSPRTPRTAVTPSSSPNAPLHRRTLRRTISGESSGTNISWKHLQNIPPPHPPPTGPLPTPPSQPNYIPRSLLIGGDLFAADGESPGYDPRESLILGISPVFEADTPNTILQATPRSSPLVDPNPVGLSGGETMPTAIRVAAA